MAHISKTITQFYLPPTHVLCSPAAKHYCPLAGTHCTYPQRDGQAELTEVLSLSVLHMTTCAYEQQISRQASAAIVCSIFGTQL